MRNPDPDPTHHRGRSAALTPEERRVWLSLQRIVTALPRALDRDLAAATGLSLSEYLVLMNLSEAPAAELRMSAIATATALSTSRITRIIGQLAEQGLVVKQRHCHDGRGATATLTPTGWQRLRAAYPAHLLSARRRLFDRLDPAVRDNFAAQLDAVAAHLGSLTARTVSA